MSHFTVLAILTQDMIAKAGTKEAALAELLIPYKEYGCGGVDPEGFVEKYCEWHDLEAEYRAEWNGEKEIDSSYLEYDTFRDAILNKLDIAAQLRNQIRQIVLDISSSRNSRGCAFGDEHKDDRIQLRADLNKILRDNDINIKFAPKDLISFKKYAEEWHGSEPDEDTPSPYGYWRNNNCKWDWYQVGGRWAGYLAKHIKSENVQKEYDKGPYGLGADSDEFFLRKDIDVISMNAEAQDNANGYWLLFQRALPYLDDSYSLRDDKRTEVFEDMRDKDEELRNFLMWSDRRTYFNLGWLKRELPEWRLCEAKRKLQEIAIIKTIAGGGSEVTYPDTYEHPWGTFETKHLVEAVNRTKFLPNRHIIGNVVRNQLGDEAFEEYEERVKTEPDTAAYIKSLPIDWDAHLNGEPVEDHLFIERREVKVKEPTIEDVLEHSYLWAWGTYAVVDKNGWYSKGEMGWFGCDDSTPESTREYKENFVKKFIETGDEDDVLVLVDCHI